METSLEYIQLLQKLVEGKINYAKRVKESNKAAARIVLSEAGELQSVIDHLEVLQKQIVELKTTKLHLEAVCLVHGITDLQFWMNKETNYIIEMAKEQLSGLAEYEHKRVALTGGKRYCLVPCLIQENYILIPKSEIAK